MIKASEHLCSSSATLRLINRQRPVPLKSLLSLPGTEFVSWVSPQDSAHAHHSDLHSAGHYPLQIMKSM